MVQSRSTNQEWCVYKLLAWFKIVAAPLSLIELSSLVVSSGTATGSGTSTSLSIVANWSNGAICNKVHMTTAFA